MSRVLLHVDGLGYYDDGEERLGDEGYQDDDSKRKRDPTAALTSSSLKKARRAKAAALKASSKGLENDIGDEDGVEGLRSTNRSMWDFVQRGGGGTANAKQSRNSGRTASAGSSRSVDALLEQLDAEVGGPPARQRRRSTPSSRRPPRRSMSNARRRHTERFGRGFQREEDDHHNAEDEQNSFHSSYNEDEEPDDSGAGFNFDDGDDDCNGEDVAEANHANSVEEVSGHPSDTASPESKGSNEGIMKRAGEPTASTPNQKVRFADDNPSAQPVTPTAGHSTPARTTDVEMEPSKTEESAAPIRRLARPKIGRRSAPAKKVPSEPHMSNIAGKGTNNAQSPVPAVDTTSVSFRPDEIAAEPTSASVASAAASNLESYVETSEKEERYLDMFWLDAFEKHGDIYLYGKVAVPNDDDANGNKVNRFVSCCAVVKGNLRNLFVLPRKKQNSDGGDDEAEYCDMMDVHQELKGILQPSCIPLREGASWAGKVVEREYAFEDPEIPREKTNYLKVVYDAKFPSPSKETCQNGGKFIHKILNAGASNLETFILKRKLMGPCWIRIQDPTAHTRGQVSWCALEVQVGSPKQICRLDLANPGMAPRPPPPVVTVTIKLKTVVNPKTHKNEIASISAVCHKQVLLDTASDESKRHMTQLSMIRPVHWEDDNNGTMARFPRDFDQEVRSKMPQLQRMPNERALLNRFVNQIGLWDPDVLVGHNAWGYDIQVILSRCVEHKVKLWSKMGRYRKTEIPNKSYFA